LFGGYKEKRKRLVQLRQADKDQAEKALFAFTDGAVLTEELGAGARHECSNLLSPVNK
jgi:hypothetical protein